MTLNSMLTAALSRLKSYLDEIARLERKERKKEIDQAKEYRKNSGIAYRMYHKHAFINLDASMALLKTVSQYDRYYKPLLIADDRSVIPIESMLSRIGTALENVSEAEYLQPFPEFQEKLLELSKETLEVNRLVREHKNFADMYGFGKNRINNLVEKYEREIQGKYAGSPESNIFEYFPRICKSSK